MIETKNLFNFLKKNKINFFSGVPDSILRDTKEILEKKNKKLHIAAASEGIAAAICMGNYLATKKMPCLYLQNSGLGNAVNPLASISHQKVYSIPLLILIGWRGAPGQKDEPQHMVKGKITKNILKNLGIKYCVLEAKSDFKHLKKLISYGKKNNKPIACLIKKNTIFTKDSKKEKKKSTGIKREIFLNHLLNLINKTTRLISTTGYTSRELNQIRLKNKKVKGKDFYMVGGMGLTSSLALGYSINSNKQVVCLDGDGSMIMHLGSLVNVGKFAGKNFKHILLNNSCHESVGGQTTNVDKVNFKNISKNFGYKNYFFLKKEVEINKILKKFLKNPGPCFLEVKIKSKAIKNLGRPKNLNIIKKNFMNF